MTLTFILNFFVVISSLLAGLFWLASATGYTVDYPWKLSKPSVPVAPADLSAHQTYWNARAALCASIAAIAQASLFLYTYYF
jgi:hypothetical protein